MLWTFSSMVQRAIGRDSILTDPGPRQLGAPLGSEVVDGLPAAGLIRGDQPPPVGVVRGREQPLRHLAERRLGPALAQRAWEQGRQMTTEEVIAYALAQPHGLDPMT